MRFALSLVLVPWLSAAPAEGPPRPLVFTGATVLDGSGGPPIGDAVIVALGDRIAAIGPSGKVEVPEGASRSDFAGKWIVPGFVDTRVGLSRSGSLFSRPDLVDLHDVVSAEDELDASRRRLDVALARHLACGVTTIADTGGPSWTFAARDRAASLAAAPRVLVSGPLVSARYASSGLDSIADPPMIAADTPEKARDAVRRLLGARPDLVLVEIPLWPGDDVGDYEPIAGAAIDAAHEGGIRAAVVARRLDAARAAVFAGADALVQGVDDAPIDDALLAEMRRRGVAYSASLAAFDMFAAVVSGSVSLSETERRFGDPEAIRSWDEVKRLPEDRLPDPGDVVEAVPTAVIAENLLRAHRAGVALAVGSNAGQIGVLHGPAFHREIGLLAKAGLPPGAILAAATRGGAEMLGRGKDLGSLAPGKFADFVVLDADPSKDATNLQRIHRVVKGGVAFDPSALVPPPR